MASRDPPASHCVVQHIASAAYSEGLLVRSKPQTPPRLRASPSPPAGDSDTECDSIFSHSDCETDCGKCLESKQLECPQYQNRYSTKLHSICSQGSLSDLKRYKPRGSQLQFGGDLNGSTPLHIACWRGLLVFVLILVKSFGFDVFECDNDRWTPLHYACDSITGDVDLITYLIEGCSCDISAHTKRGSTPLMLAVNHRNLEIIKYLTNRMGSSLDTSSIQKHLVQQTITYTYTAQPLLMGGITCGQDLESLVTDKPIKEKDLTSFETRLSTFFTAPLPWMRSQPTGEYLASIGFYFTGFEERIVCFSCDCLISSWNEKADALIQHYLKEPTCKHLKENFEHEIKRLLSQHKTPKYASSSPRLHSFANWAYSGHVTSYQLASVGFFYTGTGCKVECFSCGLVCNDLKRGDVPLLVHHQRSPLCPFLLSLLAKESSPPLQTAFSSSHSPAISPQYNPSPQYDPTPSPQLKPLPAPTRYDSYSSSEFHHHQPTPAQHSPHAPTRQPQPSPEKQASSTTPPTAADWDDEIVRLKSFKKLSANFPVSKEDCAKAGLYFLRPPDVMKCFSCLCIVKDWVDGDVPAEKHREIYPECDFIKEHFPCKLDQIPDEGFDPSTLPAPFYDAASMERLHKEHTQKSEVRYNSQQMAELTTHFTALSTQQETDPYSAQHYQTQQYLNPRTSQLRPSNSVQSSGYGSYYNTSSMTCGDEPSHSYSYSPTSPSQLPYHSSGRPITLPPSLSPRPFTIPPQVSAHSLPQITPGYSQSSYQMSHPYHHRPMYQVQPYSAPNVQPPNLSDKSPQAPPPVTPTSDDDSKLCVVCLDVPAEMACIPCGHMCLCATCSPHIYQCPICRKNITDTIKVFLP